MAPENQGATPDQQDTTDATSEDQQQDQDQQDQTPDGTSDEDGTQDQADDDKADKPEPKPDPRLKALRADLNKKSKDFQQASARVTELEAEVDKLRPVQETLDAVQTKYDRLEGFLTAVGGPLSKALDSRSFTKALFESDEDIKDIVKKWHQENPSATTTALGAGAGHVATSKVDPNQLLRIAAGK